MNQRERMLIVGVAGLAVLLVAYKLFARYSGALETNRQALVNAENALEKEQLQLKVDERSLQNLEKWQDESLPRNPEDTSNSVAVSLYRSWLTEALRQAGIRNVNIEPDPRPSVVGTGTGIGAIGFTVTGPATLENVVEFLYKFYSAPLLHQVTSIEFHPEKEDLKSVTLKVEALLLPGATNTDRMPEGIRKPFKLADVSEYRSSIVSRNIFMPYKPPTDIATARPTPPGEDPLDASRFAYFTSTTQGSKGGLIAWIHLRNTGETMFKAEGDAVNVGQLKSKIVTIEPRAIIIEADGKKSRVIIGSSLKDGKQLPNDPPKPAAKPDDAAAPAAG
ncbi:MAG: hypothetical protein WD669_11525 [Pirellulales bacterium]